MKRVVAREQQIVGTYDDETLLALLNGGTLKLADQYWDAMTSTWRPLTDFIGYSAPVRRFGPAFMRITVLLTVAGCGSLVTWLCLRDSEQPATHVRPVPEPVVAQPTAHPSASAAQPSSEKAAEKKAPAPEPTAALALLNVEVFDEEVAVTVQNNGPAVVDGFDLKLKYFVLPGDQLVFDSNQKIIAQHESDKEERMEKTRALDATLGALERHLKLVSTDVMTWTPSHIKALPTAAQWKAYGDRELSDAGAALATTAAAFASGASSADIFERRKAITVELLDLARRTEDMKPLLERAIQRTTAARNRLTAEQKDAEAVLARLKRQQDDLQPRLAELMEEARKNTIRVEIMHVDAIIEPDLVRRITVKRQKNERHGVVVELARPDEKAVAQSGSP